MAYEWYVTPAEYQQAQLHGISPQTLNRRIRDLGWHKEKAITTPPLPKKSYGQWMEIAKQNGISSKTFRNRIKLYKWDIERAATEPLMDKREHIKHIDKHRSYPKEAIEQAKKNGICYNTFTSRMQKGWGLDRASNEKVRTVARYEHLRY